MSPTSMSLRPDLALIAAAVPVGARALDVGCGDGDLLAVLATERRVDGRGLELDPDAVAAALSRGLSVVQGDADRDLVDYPDDAFDVAILSQTLQTTRAPDRVVAALLRIAPLAFVSFPNFAHWRVRRALALGGRMPMTPLLPARWYDTPNIHHTTIADFEAFTRGAGVAVVRRWGLAGGRAIGGPGLNLRAEQAVYALARA